MKRAGNKRVGIVHDVLYRRGRKGKKPKARSAGSSTPITATDGFGNPVDLKDWRFVEAVPATEAARNMRTLGGPSDTHYASLKGAQPVEIMEDWALPPHLHSVLKYIARYRSKGGMEDLKKAKWWLERYITHVEETGKF